jgi:hypothetical protein
LSIKSLSVKVNIKLFKNGKRVRTTTFTSSGINRVVGWANSDSEWDSGVCTVTYNPAKEYYNQFSFDNANQLKNVLRVDMEPELVMAFR